MNLCMHPATQSTEQKPLSLPTTKQQMYAQMDPQKSKLARKTSKSPVRAWILKPESEFQSLPTFNTSHSASKVPPLSASWTHHSLGSPLMSFIQSPLPPHSSSEVGGARASAQGRHTHPQLPANFPLLTPHANHHPMELCLDSPQAP